MRTFKWTPELAAKIEKRRRIVNVVVVTGITGHAYHSYSIVQISKELKERRSLAEERFEALRTKFNDPKWISSLEGKLHSMKETRHHVTGMYLSDEDFDDMKVRGIAGIVSPKSGGSII